MSTGRQAASGTRALNMLRWESRVCLVGLQRHDREGVLVLTLPYGRVSDWDTLPCDHAPQLKPEFLMKRETHRQMFLFATSFSWWLEDLQIGHEPAPAGLLDDLVSPAEAGSRNKVLGR